MIWFIFAFLSAFFDALKNVFSKINLKTIDEYIVAWSLRFFTLPFLIPLLYLIKIPPLKNQFWIALFIGGSLNVLTTILYMKSIKSSDLSLTIPMVTFTPLFLLITSPLIVGEFPNLLGIIGVLLIVLGSYLLNIKQTTKGYLAPFKALLKEKGPRIMLLVAFIWSITSNFDKIGVQSSSPIFWVIAINTFVTLALFPIMLFKSQKFLKKIFKNLKSLFSIGLFNGLTLIFQMIAINLTLVAYVISIKRSSAIISVLFGYLVFKEKEVKERLLGTIIMLIGVLLIMLA